MYSNEKHRENGIFDIILSVVFYIMIFCAPFVDVVVNGQIAETKTLAGFLKEHSDNTVSLILIILPVLTLVIGILKFSFSRLFYHYVLVVLDLYNGLFALAMGKDLCWGASTVARSTVASISRKACRQRHKANGSPKSLSTPITPI